MFYISGIQSGKVLTKNIVNKVVEEVEKKALEIQNNKDDTTKDN